MYYQVLVDKKLPTPILTYSSEIKLDRGSVVRVKLRDKSVLGVVLETVQDQEYLKSLSSIKSIEEVTGFALGEKQLILLANIAKNTFNSPNVIFESLVQSFDILGQKDCKKLSESNYGGQNLKVIGELNSKQREEVSKHFLEDQKSLNPSGIEFIIDSETIVRIRNIIRIGIYRYLYNAYISEEQAYNQGQMVIIFPEIKYLDKIYTGIINSEETQNEIKSLLSLFDILAINIDMYSGKPTKKSKDVIRSLMNLTSQNTLQKAKLKKEKNSLQIIFGTRSSLFLPYSNLQALVIMDEANSMYIQEQNSFYYDARDLAFVAAKTYECPLFYVSTLPSVRLYSHYEQDTLKQLLEDNESRNTAKIKLTRKQNRYDEYSLLSDNLLKHLGKKEQDIMVEGGEDEIIIS